MRKNWKSMGIVLFITLPIIFFISYYALDPDFGWHLRMGQVILEKGIPKTDPFSYTMPSFPFVDHEWLSNILMWIVYQRFGIVGLALVYTALIATIGVLLMYEKWRIWTPALLLLLMGEFISFVIIRPLVFSWIFFVILFRILLFDSVWKKWRYALPVLFLVWVNLHGGAIIALGIVFISLLLRFWTERKIHRVDGIIFIICSGTTFLNPYGWRIWEEVWRVVSDSYAHWYISEWRLTLLYLDIPIIFILAFSLVMVIKFRDTFTLTQQGLFYVMTIMAFTSIRNVPLWLFICFFMLNSSFHFFHKESLKRHVSPKTLSIILIGVIVFSTVLYSIQAMINIKQAIFISEYSFYPKKAVNYLRAHQFTGELFSAYDWGGYLIWKLPEKKVFVDGRMPSWHWNAPSQELSDGFKEYGELITGKKKVDEPFKRYNVTTVLFPIILIQKNDSQQDVLSQLKRMGWKRSYEDSEAVIYQKPTSPTQ